MSRFSNLGYFLQSEYWDNALKLLRHQIELKTKNKHFNTLSMFYYEKILASLPLLETPEYFKERVANNLFYGLDSEFRVIPYTIPKSNLGIRRQKFFTLPMRVLYYAVVLYLVDLSAIFITEYYNKNPHIFSKYGGNLRFNDRKEIVLSSGSVWYKPHYQQFRRKVIREIKDDVDAKVVLHLDIQNYYDEIEISRLLHFLEWYLKPSRLRKFKFDTTTQTQIENFFAFVESGQKGIPQSDNNIASSFVGWLYLVFADLLIEQEIQRVVNKLKGYEIIRYMDDYYILLTFRPDISLFEREQIIHELAVFIADLLYIEFGLRLNTKTRLFRLSDKDSRDDLLANLKRVSPGYMMPDDENKESPREKLNRILAQLRKLKKASLSPSFQIRKDLEIEVLKDVYIKGVQQLLSEKGVVKRIEKVFEDFNFDLVAIQPREIIVLLLSSEAAANRFEEYLLSKQRLSSRDVHLILTFLSQTDFQSPKLISKLKVFGALLPIMEIFEKGEIDLNAPGYFALNASQIMKIANMPDVIEQIRLRAFAEQKEQYSVALNHLLNEIQSISFHLDSTDKPVDKYNVHDVVRFLEKKMVPHEVRIKIRNLFDRRNKNPVSHADTAAWPVNKSEYLGYRKQVGKCLAHIL